MSVVKQLFPHRLLILCCILALFLVWMAFGNHSISDAQTQQPTLTPAMLPTWAPTATPTATPTDSPTPVPSATPTAWPTSSATQTPWPTANPTQTPWPTATAQRPTSTPQPTPTTQPNRGCGAQHTVRAGDTLASIARFYGTSVAAIMQANGLANANYIYVGQLLCIPTYSSQEYVPTPMPQATRQTPPDGKQTHVVQAGETLASIGRIYNISASEIQQANGLTNANFIYIGQSLIIPLAGGAPAPQPAPTQTVYHTVQGGETVASIARIYGTTIDAIAAANNLVNPNHIFVGQTLIIPI